MASHRDLETRYSDQMVWYSDLEIILMCLRIQGGRHGSCKKESSEGRKGGKETASHSNPRCDGETKICRAVGVAGTCWAGKEGGKYYCIVTKQ